MAHVLSNVYCANSLNYLIIHDPTFQIKFLLGLLNSKLLNWRFKKTSTNSNVNNYEIEALPIAKANEHQQNFVAAFAEKILAAKRTDHEIDTSAWEAEIDSLVYELYGLTKKEITIIENHFKMTAPTLSLSQRQPMHKAGRLKREKAV